MLTNCINGGSNRVSSLRRRVVFFVAPRPPQSGRSHEQKNRRIVRRTRIYILPRLIKKARVCCEGDRKVEREAGRRGEKERPKLVRSKQRVAGNRVNKGPRILLATGSLPPPTGTIK